MRQDNCKVREEAQIQMKASVHVTMLRAFFLKSKRCEYQLGSLPMYPKKALPLPQMSPERLALPGERDSFIAPYPGPPTFSPPS